VARAFVRTNVKRCSERRHASQNRSFCRQSRYMRERFNRLRRKPLGGAGAKKIGTAPEHCTANFVTRLTRARRRSTSQRHRSFSFNAFARRRSSTDRLHSKTSAIAAEREKQWRAKSEASLVRCAIDATRRGNDLDIDR
jgi:hypothetical protein